MIDVTQLKCPKNDWTPAGVHDLQPRGNQMVCRYCTLSEATIRKNEMSKTPEEPCKCRTAQGMGWHERGQVGWCLYADFQGLIDSLHDKTFPEQWRIVLDQMGSTRDWIWERVPVPFVAAYLKANWRSRVEQGQEQFYDPAAGLWRSPEHSVIQFLARHARRSVFGNEATAREMNREAL